MTMHDVGDMERASSNARDMGSFWAVRYFRESLVVRIKEWKTLSILDDYKRFCLGHFFT